MPRQKITEEIKQELLQLKQQGQSYSELADFLEQKYGLVRSEDSLRKLLNRTPLKAANPRPSPQQIPPAEETLEIPAENSLQFSPEDNTAPTEVFMAEENGNIVNKVKGLLAKGGETAFYIALGIVASVILVHLIGSSLPAIKNFAWLGAIALGLAVFVLASSNRLMRELALGLAAGGALQAIFSYLRPAK